MTTATKTKRLKQVFSNSEELAHIWAKQSQETGRSSNCFFSGDTIYSYGYHFPVARYVSNKPGKRIVLFTTRDYSVTTAKHKRLIRQAIPGDVTIIKCCNVTANYSSNHKDNIAALLSDLQSSANADLRAREYNHFYRSAVNNLYAYCQWAKLGRTKQLAKWNDPTTPVAEIIADLLKKPVAEVVEILARKAQRVATRAHRDEEKNRRAAERRAEENKQILSLLPWAIEQYHNHLDYVTYKGEDGPNYPISSQTILVRLDYTALRLQPSDSEPVQVETSRYAHISVETAKRIWPILKARQCPEDVEGFRAVGFTSDDTFVIGCHRIPFAEIQYIATQLGLD